MDYNENNNYERSASWSNGDSKVRQFVSRASGKQKKASPVVTLTRKTLAMLICGCLIISALFGFGGAMAANGIFGDDQESNTASTVQSTGYTLQDATGSSMTIQEITDKAKDSVVEIRTESQQYDSWMTNYVTEGAGSGVIISDDGYIMTNNHVIEGASKITVTTDDEKQYDATLVGRDSMNDVAVIKIKAKNLTPATYGNSDQLAVGEMAIAIGNPLGELGGTVTQGIISALDRELTIDGKTMRLLQTDSSINPGNSGGGLFNSEGQLVGLVVAKSSGSDIEGLGFAIPINTAAKVADQLMKNGYVENQPWSGMAYQEGSSMDSFESFFGQSTSGTKVYIYSVEGSNAKKAGFQPGDVVFAIDGKEITCNDDVSSVITSHKVGDKLKYTIVRDGMTKDITLTLQEKPANLQN